VAAGVSHPGDFRSDSRRQRAGLSTALILARAGHDVTILERDPQPLPPDVDCAATWDRPTVPQTQHTQSILALGRLILARKLPDVLDDLLAAGADCYPLADPVREPDLTTLAGPGRVDRSGHWRSNPRSRSTARRSGRGGHRPSQRLAGLAARRRCRIRRGQPGLRADRLLPVLRPPRRRQRPGDDARQCGRISSRADRTR